jgi:hypothetical protein
MQIDYMKISYKEDVHLRDLEVFEDLEVRDDAYKLQEGAYKHVVYTPATCLQACKKAQPDSIVFNGTG